MIPCLYIIVPCYNEEAVIELSNTILMDRLQELQSKKLIAEQSKILYVDDGSKDSTWEKIRAITENNTCVCAIRLARNEGHQNALMAGMKTAAQIADVIITIDADLQQDVGVIEEFLEKYKLGADIVFGIRNSRETDSVSKRLTASLFYSVMKLLGTETIRNHADYRLMSRNALNALFEYRETQLFLRGIVASMGFSTDEVYFDVKKRMAGKTKYSFGKMLSLAFNGITSLSIRPVHLVFNMGVITTLISVVMIIYNLVVYIQGLTVPGWTSILCSLWFLGGLMLISQGIIGEYIGKTYMETKRRPLYYIKDKINID